MLRLSVCVSSSSRRSNMDLGPGKERTEPHSCPRLVWEPQMQRVFENSSRGPKLGERAKRSYVSVLLTNLICFHLQNSLLSISFHPLSLLFCFPPLPRAMSWRGELGW